MEYYSAIKKEHICISSNEVDEPRTYYTERSQKEKDKYHILTHIYRIQKHDTEELIYRATMEKLGFWRNWDSFQSHRKSMPKNAQTTAQLHSSHMLVK